MGDHLRDLFFGIFIFVAEQTKKRIDDKRKE